MYVNNPRPPYLARSRLTISKDCAIVPAKEVLYNSIAGMLVHFTLVILSVKNSIQREVLYSSIWIVHSNGGLGGVHCHTIQCTSRARKCLFLVVQRANSAEHLFSSGSIDVKKGTLTTTQRRPLA